MRRPQRCDVEAFARVGFQAVGLDDEIGFGDEGGGYEAVVVQGFGSGRSGDFGGSGDEPAEVGFEGAAGIEGVGAVVGLGEVPPGVIEFGFFCPVFEAVGFDQGEEVDA